MTAMCFNPFGRQWGRVGLVAVALAWTIGRAAAAEPGDRPLPRRTSIILIQCDGLGYGDLSCYGQTNFQTPHLDRLAAEGIRFTSYYAGDGASRPARAALLLGKDPTHLKQRAEAAVPLAGDDLTVARRLKRLGYHTGLIGEWKLGGPDTSGAPWHQGFEEVAAFLTAPQAENYYADYFWRNIPSTGYRGKAVIYGNLNGKQGEYIPDLLTSAAGRFIQNNQPDPFNHYRPFFLLLNYAIPRPNLALARRTGNGLEVPTDAPYSEEPWPQAEKNRAAMIARLDDDIGRLLARLKATRLSSNTVIFFTSDTGPEKGGGVDPQFFHSAGPFRGGRGDLYEGGLRVPMIVRWPGTIAPGRVSDLVWAAWDFLPTAMAIAFATPPAGLDGRSVLPTLLGQTQTNRHHILSWELRGRHLAQAARMGPWKIVRARPDDSWALYNLKTDPGEATNVAAHHPGVIARLERLMKKAAQK